MQSTLPFTTRQVLFTPSLLKKTPRTPSQDPSPRLPDTKTRAILKTHLENIWRRVFRVRGSRGAVSAVVVVVVRLLIVDGYDLLPVVGHVVEAVVRVEDASVQLLQVVHGHPRVRWLREGGRVSSTVMSCMQAERDKHKYEKEKQT